MGITSNEVLHRLRQSGRCRFTERQLTDFRCKQLLPPLQRDKQPGSRKPMYLWDEGVVAQVAYLHDLLQWDRQHDRLYLPLWLAGHDIPLRAVRRIVLRFIERHLSRLTQGKTDPDDILDHVSTLIYERMLPRWKYSPKKREPIQSLGVETWAEIVELTFDFLATPLYEPDLELLADLVLRVARRQKEPPPEIKTDPESLFRAAAGIQQILRQLSPLFSIPKLKEAVELATLEEWLRAQHYYQVLRNTTDFIIVEINACLPEPFPDAFFYRVAMNGALYLLPLFLSLIYQGQTEPLERGEQCLGTMVEFLKQRGWSVKHPREVLLEIVHQYEVERVGLEERKAG
jgi:hypothetical protein